jgi:hypothetical protein
MILLLHKPLTFCRRCYASNRRVIGFASLSGAPGSTQQIGSKRMKRGKVPQRRRRVQALNLGQRDLNPPNFGDRNDPIQSNDPIVPL